jgi:hypothetical protein
MGHMTTFSHSRGNLRVAATPHDSTRLPGIADPFGGKLGNVLELQPGASTLNAQDLRICVKLVVIGEDTPSFGRLAGDVMMSPSQVYSAVGRATVASAMPSAGRSTKRCSSSSCMACATPTYAQRRTCTDRPRSATLAEQIAGDGPARRA